MSDLTIPARLVAEGVGLPAMWFEPDGCVMTRVTLASKGQAQRRPKTPARRGGHPTYWLIDEGHDAGPPWVRGVT